VHDEQLKNKMERVMALSRINLIMDLNVYGNNWNPTLPPSMKFSLHLKQNSIKEMHHPTLC